MATGMVFEGGLKTFLTASLVLMFVTLLGRPVISILLLPINLVTFGMFKWVSSAIALYLVSLIVPGFYVVGFYYQGFVSKWVDIPSLNLEGWMAYVGFSFLLSLISGLLHWVRKD